MADGDITVDRPVGCIFITRGSFVGRVDDGKNLVLAGGDARYTSRQRGSSAPGALQRGIPKLLGWVRFFEISDAGLEVAAADGGVKVTKVTDKQPPQKAELRVGDVITKINATGVKDVEQFRRLLRRGTVREAVRFTVLRDAKPLELTASFVGWEPPPVKP